MIVYVNGLLVTCKDESSKDGIIAALKAKYIDIQEQNRAKHSYLGMFLDLSLTGVCPIIKPIIIADTLNYVELGSVVTPASGT